MCVLRVAGANFDVEGYLCTSTLKPCKVFKAGEPRLPRTKPDGPKHNESGFTVVVSNADWTVNDQIADARAFIVEHETELALLCSAPGLDARLDFPVDQVHAPYQSEYFPPDLVRAAGRVGLGIEITVYRTPRPDEDEDGADGAS